MSFFVDPTTTTPSAPADSQELAGDVSPLARALGPTDALASITTLADLLGLPRPQDPTLLPTLLAQYRRQVLEAIELPAVVRAYELAAQGRVRELLQLDAEVGRQLGRSEFADASRHVGRTQLRRLRPLRERALQRYLQAVDAGDAAGWHVVVFGILLALFALPLRQGLQHYLATTHERLVEVGAAGLRLTAVEQRRLLDASIQSIPESLAKILPANPFASPSTGTPSLSGTASGKVTGA